MDTQTLLNILYILLIILATGAIILVVAIILFTLRLIMILKNFQTISKNIVGVFTELLIMKDTIKLGFLRIISSILGRKGGE